MFNLRLKKGFQQGWILPMAEVQGFRENWDHRLADSNWMITTSVRPGRNISTVLYWWLILYSALQRRSTRHTLIKNNTTFDRMTSNIIWYACFGSGNLGKGEWDTDIIMVKRVHAANIVIITLKRTALDLQVWNRRTKKNDRSQLCFTLVAGVINLSHTYCN